MSFRECKVATAHERGNEGKPKNRQREKKKRKRKLGAPLLARFVREKWGF
jgi:hypothetical protein